MKTIKQEGFAFDSYDKADGGSLGFQGGMTAPPKGFERNFTPPHLYLLKPPDREEEEEDRGVFVPPNILLSSLSQPAFSRLPGCL